MRNALFLAAAGAVLAFVGWSFHRPVDPRCLPVSAVNAAETYSNILPHDYVGPATCAQCHPQQHGLWSHHSHSRMNQLPDAHSVQGDFAGAVLRLPDAAVRFCTTEGDYLVDVERGGRPLRRYQVSRTVGSRTMQFYIGRQVEGPEPREHALYGEHMLPFAYSFQSRRWLPKNYFDPDGPDDLQGGIPQVEGVDKISDVRAYNQICMNCHNTFPYAYRIFHPELCGFPDATVAAAVAPLSAALAKTRPVAATIDGLVGLNSRLDPDVDLVTLGISCESCHFGGREHARRHQKIRFAPTSPLVQVKSHNADRPVTGQRKNAATINGICIQCHSGQAKMFPNGSATCNSREGLDFHAGACASRMSCVDCHEPHTAEGRAGGPTNPRHVAACVRCHTQYDDAAAAQAHSRHSAASGVNCLDCHMPRYSQGLDELVRTHRIGLPVEESMFSQGAANACNLCHLDKPLKWTLNELKHGWGQSVLRQPPWTQNSATRSTEPLGEVWLRSTDAAMRLVAVQSYARSPLGQGKLPEMIEALNDSDPINRVFAVYAVERVTGKPLDLSDIDITAPFHERQRQVEALRRRLVAN